MRVGELVDEPGLAHSGLAHDGHHLAAARAGLAEHPAQVLDLGIATHETREAAQGRSLQARVRTAGTSEFVHFHRLGHTLDRHRSQRAHPHVALNELEGIGAEQRGARAGELLHARR